MKKGFTLSETLITLCIIGIVAALCAPVISNLRPNEYKTKYMKAYNTLSKIVPEILDDEDLYTIEYGPTGKPTCMGLTCNNKPNVAPFNVSGDFLLKDTNLDYKFGKILASKLNLQSGPNEISAGTESTSFYTQDGIYWLVAGINGGATYDADNRTSNRAELVFIDVDPNNDNGADFYSADNTNPHRFGFKITFDGGLVPMDKMGKAYLLNATDMHNIEKDKTSASEQNDDSSFSSAVQEAYKSIIDENK